MAKKIKRCLADDGYWKRKPCNKDCEYYDTCIYQNNEQIATEKLSELQETEKYFKESNRHNIGELQIMQSYSLERKIQLTCERIKAWYEWWDGQVYVSFSGGKDSTVLLDLVRNVCGYDDVPAVFVDTGLEYPEIREFVKTFDNVEWLKPKKNFKQVIKEYGYPFISKEVSGCVWGAKKYLTSILELKTLDKQASKQASKHHISTTTKNYVDSASMLNPSRGGQIESIANSEELANLLNQRIQNREGGKNYRLARLLGMMTKQGEIKTKENIPSKDLSMFAQTKYQFFLDAPFDISNKCCNVMKKEPAHRFEKKTGLKPIIATTCAESMLRTQKWMQEGCNAFYSDNPKSKPMSFWTEQDVLLYIKTRNLPIASVYGEIVTDYEGMNQCEGQMDIAEFLPTDKELFELDNPLLKTTGCSRTGCIFCGFGCHLEKEGEGRFERLKETHPKQYEYIMKPTSKGGLGYKEIIDWINEHGNMHIRY